MIAAGKPTAVRNAQNALSNASTTTDTFVNVPILLTQVGTICASTTPPEQGSTQASKTLSLVLYDVSVVFITFILVKLVQTWFAISVAKRSKRNSVTGLPDASLYCKHAGNVIIGNSNLGVIEPVELAHICTTIACNTGTKVVGVTPGIFKQVKSKPVRLGFAITPSVIKVHTSVANLNTTSEIVSPLHKFMQAISGPCHTTQLEDILSHPFVVPLEFVGIINVLFLL